MSPFQALIIYIGQPGQHVPFGMKHTPDIYMSLEFKIENDPRESFQPYGPQPGQVQLMRPPWGSCRWHFPDEAIGLFKSINEAEGHIRASFVSVLPERKVDILPRFGAR